MQYYKKMKLEKQKEMQQNSKTFKYGQQSNDFEWNVRYSCKTSAKR